MGSAADYLVILWLCSPKKAFLLRRRDYLFYQGFGADGGGKTTVIGGLKESTHACDSLASCRRQA